MIDWPVKRRGGCRWARRSALLLGGGLCAALVSNVAAMVPADGRSESAVSARLGDRDRPGYEAYVVARGELLATSAGSALAAHRAAGIPAFARKYGLACSACHTAWPELNSFG